MDARQWPQAGRYQPYYVELSSILRHYIDIERGDLFRALGRYNGSLGRPEYPTLVVNAWQKNWRLAPATKTAGL